MRTYSTPQSAHNLEITKLAIFECVVSVLLYVAIGLYLGTFKYLAMAVVFAPLMLFRTNVSAEWGLAVYKRFLNILEEGINVPATMRAIVLVVCAPVVGVMLRIVATLYWMVRRPLLTLKDAPENWVRQGLCTDFAHPPEILPLEALKGDTDFPTFVGFLELFRESDRWARLFLLIVITPFIAVGWLPSITYRISFKATAIAYAPIMWVAHVTLGSVLTLKTRLERITKGEFEKVRRGLSWLILSTGLGKIALATGWAETSYLESKFPSKRFVHSFLILDHWPWWQITLGIDALLTFTLFFFADAALARIEGEKTWGEEFVLKTVSTVSFVRAALGIITISHFFIIALRSAAPQMLAMLR